MNIAVIFAGGIGSRMRSTALPKQFLEVRGTPLIVHTIRHFQDHPQIDGIAVAILADWRAHFTGLVARHQLDKVRWIVDGGVTGQDSRHLALRAVADDAPSDAVVLIHDGVRPLIDEDLISANIRTVRERGAAVTCTKFHETMIVSHGDRVDDVIPRDELYVAGAPQSLRLGDALQLYDAAVADGEHDSIDTCSLLRRYGHPVYRVDGPRSNIKITTAEDYYICRAFFDLIEAQQSGI